MEWFDRLWVPLVTPQASIESRFEREEAQLTASLLLGFSILGFICLALLIFLQPFKPFHELHWLFVSVLCLSLLYHVSLAELYRSAAFSVIALSNLGIPYVLYVLPEPAWFLVPLLLIPVLLTGLFFSLRLMFFLCFFNVAYVALVARSKMSLESLLSGSFLILAISLIAYFSWQVRAEQFKRLLKEKEGSERFEKLMVEMIDDFAQDAERPFEDSLSSFFDRSAKYLNADSAGFYLCEGKACFHRESFWQRTKEDTFAKLPKYLDPASVLETPLFENHEVVILKERSVLGHREQDWKNWMLRFGQEANLLVWLSLGETAKGFLLFSATSRRVEWKEQAQKAALFVADAIAGSWSRRPGRLFEEQEPHSSAPSVSDMFIGAVPLSAAKLSLEGSFVQVNEFACDVLGYSENELLGRSFEELLHPESSFEGIAWISQIGHPSQSDFQEEYRLLKKDGSYLDVLVTFGFEYDSFENPTFCFVQFVNITTHRKVEKSLHEDLEQVHTQLHFSKELASKDLRQGVEGALKFLVMKQVARRACLVLFHERPGEAVQVHHTGENLLELLSIQSELFWEEFATGTKGLKVTRYSPRDLFVVSDSEFYRRYVVHYGGELLVSTLHFEGQIRGVLLLGRDSDDRSFTEQEESFFQSATELLSSRIGLFSEERADGLLVVEKQERLLVQEQQLREFENFLQDREESLNEYEGSLLEKMRALQEQLVENEEKDQDVTARYSELHKLLQVVARKERTIHEHEKSLELRASTLEEKSFSLNEKASVLEEKSFGLDERTSALNEKTHSLTELESALHCMEKDLQNEQIQLANVSAELNASTTPDVGIQDLNFIGSSDALDASRSSEYRELERMRTIVQKAPESVFVFDSELRVLWANQTVYESLGYDLSGEFLPFTILGFPESFLVELRSHLISEKKEVESLVPLNNPNGEERWLLASARPILFEEQASFLLSFRTLSLPKQTDLYDPLLFEQEALLEPLSSIFLEASPFDLNQPFEEALSFLCDTFSASLAAVAEYDEEHETYNFSYLQFSPKAQVNTKVIQYLITALASRLLEPKRPFRPDWSGKCFELPRTDEGARALFQTFQLPKPTEEELRSLKSSGEGLFSLMPILLDGRLYGMLCLYFSDRNMEPKRKPQPRFLKSVANVFGRALIARFQEEKRLQVEKQSQREKRLDSLATLAGGIAQDFSNLLTPIIGNLELAMSDWGGDPGLHSLLDAAWVSSEQAKDLVQQISVFAKKHKVLRMRLDLHVVLQKVIDLVQSNQPKDLQIVLQKHSVHSIVLADFSQIQQVFFNLCINAVEAMSSGGVLEIATSDVFIDEELAGVSYASGHYVKIEIRDTGTGILGEHLSSIFEPFFTTKTGEQGAGLGLSVVYGILNRHNSKVVVEETSSDGTVFAVYMPTAEADYVSESQEHELTSLRGTGRILVIDDQPAILQVLAKMLKRLGYEYQLFVDPHKALRAFLRNPHSFDFVLVDQTMPMMKGLAFLERVHALRPDLPAVLCTGFQDELPPHLTQMITHFEILPKPFRQSELGACLKQLDKH